MMGNRKHSQTISVWLGCCTDIPVPLLVSLTLQDLWHFHSCLDWFFNETGSLLNLIKIQKLELETDYQNLTGKPISLAVLSLCLGNLWNIGPTSHQDSHYREIILKGKGSLRRWILTNIYYVLVLWPYNSYIHCS